MNSPGKKTGVGSHSLLQGIFPSHGLNPGLLRCRQIRSCLSHQGSPKLVIICYCSNRKRIHLASSLLNPKPSECMQRFPLGRGHPWPMTTRKDTTTRPTSSGSISIVLCYHLHSLDHFLRCYQKEKMIINWKKKIKWGWSFYLPRNKNVGERTRFGLRKERLCWMKRHSWR